MNKEKLFDKLVDLACWSSCAIRFRQLHYFLEEKRFSEFLSGLSGDGGRAGGNQNALRCFFCTMFATGDCNGRTETHVNRPCPFGEEISYCTFDVSNSLWVDIEHVGRFLYQLEEGLYKQNLDRMQIGNVCTVISPERVSILHTLGYSIPPNVEITWKIIKKNGNVIDIDDVDLKRECRDYLDTKLTFIIDHAEKRALEITNEISDEFMSEHKDTFDQDNQNDEPDE